MSSEARQLARKLQRKGFDVRITGSGHYEVRDALGRRVTVFSCTPGDSRWRSNAVAAVRRWKRGHGIPVSAGELCLMSPQNPGG